MDPTHALAREVLIHGPILRSALCRRLGFSPPTLTRLAKPLLDSGLIIESAHSESIEGTLGRPAIPLDVAIDARQYMGVKVTDDVVVAVVTNQRAATFERVERAITDLSPDSVIDVIVELRAELEAAAGVTIDAIGVGVGGPVTDGRIVEFVRWLGWGSVDLGGLLASRTGLSVTVSNDLVAFVEGERWFGVGRDVSDFVVVTIGAGIGYGLVLDGDFVRPSETAFEAVSHYPLDPAGPPCFLGHRGCATAMLTVAGVCERFEIATGERVEYDRVMALAAQGHPAARVIAEDSARALGRLIAVAVNLTMVDQVLVAGEGTTIFDGAGDTIRDAIASDRGEGARTVTLMVDRSGFVNWAKGAAAVAIEATFDLAVDRATAT